MELLRPAQRLFARYTWTSLERIRTGWSSTTAIHAILATATIVLVTRTGHAPVIIIVDAPVTRLDVIVIEMKGAELMVSVQPMTICLVVSVRDIISATATEMMDVGTICTALRAMLMVSVVTIIAAAVIVTGTVPLATVSATGS